MLGDLIEQLQPRPPFWIATKVWTRGREAGARQIDESMRGAAASTKLDLLQIHNLLDWREHVPTLRALRDAGKVRHVGITHYRADAHAELERVLAAERFDCVQLNYSLAEREAEQRLLPFCREHGIGGASSTAHSPTARCSSASRTSRCPTGRDELGIYSWGQYFLKWIVAHPAVTCVIPATSRARHMQDNCRAGFGPLPDAKQRERMAALVAMVAHFS